MNPIKLNKIVKESVIAYSKSMQFDYRIYLLSGWLLLVFLKSTASADEVSSREACRKAVAGTYLSTYDKWERSRQYAKLLTANLSKQKTALAAQQKQYDHFAKLAKDSEFDVKKAEDREAALALLNAIKGQIADNEKLLAAAKAEQNDMQEMVKRLKAKIVKVFEITEILPRRQDTYPIQLNYKSSCSQYRYTCPLPRQEASDLLALVDDVDSGDSCKKYAAISGIE